MFLSSDFFLLFLFPTCLTWKASEQYPDTILITFKRCTHIYSVLSSVTCMWLQVYTDQIFECIILWTPFSWPDMHTFPPFPQWLSFIPISRKSFTWCYRTEVSFWPANNILHSTFLFKYFILISIKLPQVLKVHISKYV